MRMFFSSLRVFFLVHHDKICNLRFQSEGALMKFACLLSSCLKVISGNLGSVESSPLSSSYSTLLQYYILLLIIIYLFILSHTYNIYNTHTYINYNSKTTTYPTNSTTSTYNITACLAIAFGIISSFFLGYLHWSKPSFCHCEDNCQGCEWQPTHVCGRPVFRDCVGKRFSWNDNYESNSRR